MSANRVSDQLIESVRDQNDLVSIISEYLSLKRSGQNFLGLCPFHGEKTPSFTVSPSKQIFHCFGCGAGGNVYQFLIKMEGLSFPEALERLAEKAGIALPKREKWSGNDSGHRESDQIYKINEEAALYFHKNMDRPEAARALAYLKKRGVSRATIEGFSIGVAVARRDDLLKTLSKKFSTALLEKAGLISKSGREEGGSSDSGNLYDRFRNRIIFPIRTPQGKVVGFGGRVLDDSQPKYLNSPETLVYTKGKHLFALDQARKKGGGHSLVIVEGYFDVIAAHQAGVTNVVATLGTALTQDHLQLIRRMTERVTLLFDPDEAGIRAAIRTAPLLIEKGISAQVASLPTGEDPDLFIQKNGKEAFLGKIAEGEPLIDFVICRLAQASPSKSIDDKITIVGEVFPLIGLLKNKIEQGHYLKNLAEELNLEEPEIRTEFSKYMGRKSSGLPAAPKSAEGRGIPALSVSLPKDEEMIAILLIQGHLDISFIKEHLKLDDFSSPPVRELLSHFWDGSKEGAFTQVPSDREEIVALWRKLSLSKIDADKEDIPQIATDCLSSIQAKKLHRERGEIQRKLKLAERGGDLSRVESLQREFLALKRN